MTVIVVVVVVVENDLKMCALTMSFIKSSDHLKFSLQNVILNDKFSLNSNELCI